MGKRQDENLAEQLPAGNYPSSGHPIKGGRKGLLKGQKNHP